MILLYRCEKCKYLFGEPEPPGTCPDCGAADVREAKPDEYLEYQKIQEILRKERW